MAHIILADDDELLCDLVQFKLAAAGHRVQIVTDGQKALEAVGVEKPDLLILDSMMPVLSGPQLLSRLKASPETSAIPIIMLTARKSRDDVVGALEAGADDYITKPFIPEEFNLRVNAVLRKHKDADVAP